MLFGIGLMAGLIFGALVVILIAKDGIARAIGRGLNL